MKDRKKQRVITMLQRKQDAIKTGPMPVEAIDPLTATARLLAANQKASEAIEGEYIEPDSINVRPLSIKVELFLRLYLQCGNPGDAAEGAGYPRQSGTQLLRNPLVRARIAHAMGESWITPEAIVSGLATLAFNDFEEGHNRVKAFEILAKTKGMFVDPIKLGAMPKDAAALDALLINEFRRVRGEDPGQQNVLGIGAIDVTQPSGAQGDTPGTPGATDTQALQPQAPDALPPLDTCLQSAHLRIRVASDGWLCDLCGCHGKCARFALEQQLGIRNYIYRDGIWYHPRARRDFDSPPATGLQSLVEMAKKSTDR